MENYTTSSQQNKNISTNDTTKNPNNEESREDGLTIENNIRLIIQKKFNLNSIVKNCQEYYTNEIFSVELGN